MFTQIYEDLDICTNPTFSLAILDIEEQLSNLIITDQNKNLNTDSFQNALNYIDSVIKGFALIDSFKKRKFIIDFQALEALRYAQEAYKSYENLFIDISISQLMSIVKETLTNLILDKSKVIETDKTNIKLSRDFFYALSSVSLTKSKKIPF